MCSPQLSPQLLKATFSANVDSAVGLKPQTQFPTLQRPAISPTTLSRRLSLALNPSLSRTLTLLVHAPLVPSRLFAHYPTHTHTYTRCSWPKFGPRLSFRLQHGYKSEQSDHLALPATTLRSRRAWHFDIAQAFCFYQGQMWFSY